MCLHARKILFYDAVGTVFYDADTGGPLFDLDSRRGVCTAARCGGLESSLYSILIRASRHFIQDKR